MVAKKKTADSDNSRPLIPNPNYKKPKPASAADFRKKEEEDKRIARETKRNPKDASGASYFGATMKDKFKTPGQKMPAGTPFKVRSKDDSKSPNPSKPKMAPKATPKKMAPPVKSEDKSLIRKKK